MLIEKEALAGSFHSKSLPNVTQKNAEESRKLIYWESGIGQFKANLPNPNSQLTNQ